MNWVTCNPLRTIGMPFLSYIKPNQMFREIDTIRQADIILFPEYWQVNSLVYGLKKLIFPSVSTFHLGHNKVEMTRALSVVSPEYIPYTEILANSVENKQSILDSFTFPFVAKEIKNSMGQGVFLIENKQQWRDYTERNDILYVQEYLSTDRDLRVCIVGGEVVAAYWRIADHGQFLHNIARGGRVSFEDIPLQALNVVLQTAKQLDIDHAGFDVMMVDGHPYILEFNVLFGNQGLTERGIRIEQHMERYIMELLKPTLPRAPITPFTGKAGKIIS